MYKSEEPVEIFVIWVKFQKYLTIRRYVTPKVNHG